MRFGAPIIYCASEEGQADGVRAARRQTDPPSIESRVSKQGGRGPAGDPPSHIPFATSLLEHWEGSPYLDPALD